MLLCAFILFYSYVSTIHSYVVPFSTSGNKIIDGSGNIVRLKCVNWPGSMETLMPEGLQHNSIENIVLLIKQMNMSCVRLTYSIELTLSSNLTVYQSLSRLNLTFALQGFQENNPLLLNRSVSYVFDSVLNTLEQSNIFVLLDNHISKAMWCCAEFDGNGFWGDKYFIVQQWIDGLKFMAKKTVDRPYVVAMSLRNELRGLRQNLPDWYRYVLRGILEAISFINPRLLIVISGLNYDLDLSFIRNLSIQSMVPQSIRNKIVYETHWYSWSFDIPISDCDRIKDKIQNNWAFILELNQTYTAPVWLTEFGTNVDQFTGDDQFIDCVKDFLQISIAKTMSWSYWTLAGIYYIRSGTIESHESFGLLNDDWKEIKSKSFISILSEM